MLVYQLSSLFDDTYVYLLWFLLYTDTVVILFLEVLRQWGAHVADASGWPVNHAGR